MIARCLDCGEHFHREPDQAWKKRCYSCWLKTKSPAPATDPAYQEFIENLKPLIQLTHPDRHNNSLLANRISGWLLGVRNRIAGRQHVE